MYNMYFLYLQWNIHLISIFIKYQASAPVVIDLSLNIQLYRSGLIWSTYVFFLCVPCWGDAYIRVCQNKRMKLSTGHVNRNTNGKQTMSQSPNSSNIQWTSRRKGHKFNIPNTKKVRKYNSKKQKYKKDNKNHPTNIFPIRKVPFFVGILYTERKNMLLIYVYIKKNTELLPVRK